MMRSGLLRHQGGVASALHQWTPVGAVVASSQVATPLALNKSRSYGNTIQRRYPFHQGVGPQAQPIYYQQMEPVASFANRTSSHRGNSR